LSILIFILLQIITGTAKQVTVLKNTLVRLLRSSALWIVQYR